MSESATALELPTAFRPDPPRAIEDLDIPSTLVQDIFLRSAREEGTASLTALRDRLKLPISVLQFIFDQLRRQQCIDVKRMQDNDYFFSLTQSGKALAAERAGLSTYSGPAPVSISSYERAVRLQAAHVTLNREALRNALADLVLPERLLDQLGPALISQKALFLYGPTGNGKSSLAERLLRIYDDAILIPYAVEFRGHIITVFDPLVHQRVETEDQALQLDARWVVCHRPSVIAGGEMVSGMLELNPDPASGIYGAPLQIKANNGILVIDDFGRQVMSPRELLNRWILPLDRRVDYLAVENGQKLRVPFELVVVFATNLDPSELADEAFLRRIHNKIYVGNMTEEDFRKIIDRAVTERQIPCDEDAASYLIELCLRHSGMLRACYPGDLCDILLWRSRYEGHPPRITVDALDKASEVYFMRARGAGKA